MLISGVANVRYGWRLTIGSSDRVAASVRQGGEVDDWDKVPSFDFAARRSTSRYA